MITTLPSIRIHPSRLQVVANEWPAIVCVIVLTAVSCSDGFVHERAMPYIYGTILALILYLAYRYVYITRTVYEITAEQLKHEYGLFSRRRSYIELYRIVDYSEQRSFLQMILGLKTVSIYSGDRTHPRLDIIGIDNRLQLIPEIRERVEFNKRYRNIHEFTNM